MSSSHSIKDRFRSLFRPTQGQSTFASTSRSISKDEALEPDEIGSLSQGQFKATKLWTEVIEHVRTHLEVKRRRHKFRFIDACATGSDVTSCVLEFLHGDPDAFTADVSRDKAAKVCQLLIDKNILKSATGTMKPFEDSSKRLFQLEAEGPSTPDRTTCSFSSLQSASTSSGHLIKSPPSKENSAGAVYHRISVAASPTVTIPPLPQGLEDDGPVEGAGGLATPEALNFAAMCPLAQFYSNHMTSQPPACPLAAPLAPGESSDLSASYLVDKTRAQASSNEIDPEGDDTQEFEGEDGEILRPRVSRKRSKSRARAPRQQQDSDTDAADGGTREERPVRRVKSRSKSCPYEKKTIIETGYENQACRYEEDTRNNISEKGISIHHNFQPKPQKEQQNNHHQQHQQHKKQHQQQQQQQHQQQQHQQTRMKTPRDGKTLMAVTQDERRVMLAMRESLKQQRRQRQLQQKHTEGVEDGGEESNGGEKSCALGVVDGDHNNKVAIVERAGSSASSSVDFCDVNSDPENNGYDWTADEGEKMQFDVKRKEKEMKKVIKKYREKTAKTEALLHYIDQLRNETDEITKLYTQADKTSKALKNEIKDMKTKLGALSEKSIAAVRKNTKAPKLEPMIYRRYLNIKNETEATLLLSAIRARQAALCDMELLAARRRLMLQHKLPGHQGELTVCQTKPQRKPRVCEAKGEGSGRGRLVTVEIVDAQSEDTGSSTPKSKGSKKTPLTGAPAALQAAVLPFTPPVIGPQLPVGFRRLLGAPETGLPETITSSETSSPFGFSSGAVSVTLEGLTSGTVTLGNPVQGNMTTGSVTRRGETSDSLTTVLGLGGTVEADVYVDIDGLFDDDDSDNESTPTFSFTPSLDNTEL